LNKAFLYQEDLYLSILRNLPQDASAIDLDKRLFLIMFLGFNPSTRIVWFSATIVVDSLWRKSFLAFAILS